jgi:hypothetical protein
VIDLDTELAARGLVDQWAVRVAGWWPSQDQSEELAHAILALAESRPSDGFAAAPGRWAFLDPEAGDWIEVNPGVVFVRAKR